MAKWLQDPEDEFDPQAAPLNPTVRDYIAKKYGISDSVSNYNLAGDVADAQRAAADVQFGDDLARAGATIGAAISGPGVKVDEGFWSSKAARNQQGVKDAITRQEAADSDIERGRRDLKMADEEKVRQQQSSLADPNNRLAKLAREKLKSIGYNIDESMSLTDMKAAGIDPFGLFDKTKQREYEDKLRAEDRELRRLDAKDRADERSLIREERKADKEERLQEKRDIDTREREVPGVGVAMTKQDAKDLKSATEMKAKFDRMLEEMIGLRKNKGAEVWDREAVQRGQQLSKDLLLAYKDLAKLGVLSQSDEAILNKIIPSDPLEWNASSLMPGQGDPTLSRLEKFQNDIEQDYQTRLATRLQSRAEKPKTAGTDAKTTTMYAPGSRVKVKGSWYVVGEDGDSLIPETQTAGK